MKELDGYDRFVPDSEAPPIANGWVGAEEASADPEPLVGFKLSDLSGLDVPEREWHVADIMPERAVTLFMGNGGDGKSLLALQLCVATATGGRWLGRQVKPGRVLYLSAEDDQPEVHRRAKDIAYAEGVTLAGLGDIEVLSMVGEDVVLAAPDRDGTMKRTTLLSRLVAAIERWRPKLLVLDTLADVFGGDEIKKIQVRQFVSMLTGLCIQHDLTVLLIGHPSQSGMASGEGTSGNVAWSNSVRMRWYLEPVRTDPEDPKSATDPLLRQLVVKKSNYGPSGEAIRVRWHQGVYVREQDQSRPSEPVAAAHAEAVFLDLLREFQRQGRHVSQSPSPTYAPKVFSREPDRRGITKAGFEAAMSRLLKAGRIAVVTTGSPSRQRTRLTVPPSN